MNFVFRQLVLAWKNCSADALGCSRLENLTRVFRAHGSDGTLCFNVFVAWIEPLPSDLGRLFLVSSLMWADSFRHPAVA